MLRGPSRNGRRLATSSEVPGEVGCCLGRWTHPEPPGQWGGAQNWEALLGSHCSSLTMEGSLLAPLMNSSRDSLPRKEKGGGQAQQRKRGGPAPDGGRVAKVPTGTPEKPWWPASPLRAFDCPVLEKAACVSAGPPGSSNLDFVPGLCQVQLPVPHLVI